MKQNTGASAIAPTVGLVTWESEGTEGGKFHSRKLGVPSDSSGLTIGRGYDMKERKAPEIIHDLTAANVTFGMASTLSKAAGLSGDDAKEFIVENKLESFEISKAGQKNLFDRTYQKIRADVHRICSKVDVTAKYGRCDWKTLHPAIVDILVDLRFRGDYTGHARTLLQKFVTKNDLVHFAEVIQQFSHWPEVPLDRLKRRARFIAAAVASLPKTNVLAGPAAKQAVAARR